MSRLPGHPCAGSHRAAPTPTKAPWQGLVVPASRFRQSWKAMEELTSTTTRRTSRCSKHAFAPSAQFRPRNGIVGNVTLPAHGHNHAHPRTELASGTSVAGNDPVNITDPLGLWGWNPISDIRQAAHDVGHYVAKHKAAIAQIAVGLVVVVGATVLTAGLGDAILAAGAAAAEESAAAGAEFAATGAAESLWGVMAPVDLALHAPFYWLQESC